MDEHTLERAVQKTFTKGNGDWLDKWIADEATICFKNPEPEQVGTFPARVFERIISLLDEGKLLEVEGAWTILRLFGHDWGCLTAPQRERLLGALERVFGTCSHWMACFVISELLGEYYADASALETLMRLEALEDDDRRCFVPHGLEHVVLETTEHDVRMSAYAALERMQQDRSEQVRDEVASSLSNVRAKMKMGTQLRAAEAGKPDPPARSRKRSRKRRSR